MRIGLLADIHGNLPALEAAMEGVLRHKPDMIISLGDQVNLGPSPREVLSLLRAENVQCVSGNHERYILSAMKGDPAYQAANFAAPRFNCMKLTREDITFPDRIDIGGVTLCHAMPGDDRFPVYDEERALPLLAGMTFDRPTHIICGHGHNPTHITLGNLRIDSIGSVGCMDDGVPGTAPYAILTLGQGGAMIRPYYVKYDVGRLKPLFIASGMADYCPIMSHIICEQMTTNTDYLVPFVERAQAMSRAKGESAISEETWVEADRSYPWPDGISTEAFWGKYALGR